MAKLLRTVYSIGMSALNDPVGTIDPVFGKTWPRLSPLGAALLAVGMLLLVAFGDYVTGWYFLFDFFYLIPLSVVTLYVGRHAGLYLAFACTVAWSVVMVVEGHPLVLHEPTASAFIWLWNFVTRLLVQTAFVWLLARLVDDVRRQRQLVTDLKDALAQVNQLRNLIPICAWCKKIRDDAGYWKQLDQYMQERELATFTHGICPDCAAKEFEK